MKKETLTDKLIKHFYGIAGPLDEYKRREADKIGNIAFIWLSWILLIGNAIALIIGYRYPEMMAIAYPILLEVILLSLFVFVIWKGRQAQIAQFDKEELEEKEGRKFPYKGPKSGVFFGLFMHLWAGLMDYWFDGTSFLTSLLSPHLLLRSLISGLVFGLAIHVVILLRQRKESE